MSGKTISRRLTRRTFMAAAGVAALLVSSAPALAADTSVTQADVMVTTPDGSADADLFYPAKGKGPWPAVILWHDGAGLRAVTADMGRKLAGEGFVVLAPNAFYRAGKAPGDEPDMRDAKMRERQTAARATATDDGVMRDAVAFVAYLDGLKQTAKGKKLGTVGFDVGGGYAFRTAAALPDRIAAVASIHGTGVATPRPNSPHLLVPKTHATYLVVQSKDDDAREPTDKDDYNAVLAEGKLHGVVDVYPANHGFAIPGNANYDAASADKAWGEIVKLMKATLK